MKSITYNISSNGNRIALGISSAKIDPRETRNAAITALQTTPEYAELLARITTYNDYINQLVADGYKVGKPDTLPSAILTEMQNKLTLVAQQQATLRQMEADYIAANPIYLTPMESVLVDDATADLVSADMVENKYVKINVDANGDFTGHVQADSVRGTVYRLPNSLSWISATEPDEDIPAEALYVEPDQAEIDIIEANRIDGLTAGEKATEKATMNEIAQNQYVHDSTMADILGTQQEIDDAKAAALQAYNNRLAELDGIYGP